MPNANKNEIKRVEITIGNILRWGVLISAAIMIAGLLLFMLKGGLGYPNGYYAKSFRQIWDGLIQLKPYAVMMLGIFAVM